MRAIAALLALLTAACSGPGAVSSPNPSPSIAPSAEGTACGAPRDPQEAPTGDAIVAAIALGCEAGAVAVGGGSVWVVPHLDPVALRIDPLTNAVIDQIPLGDRGPGAEIDGSDQMIWASVSSPTFDLERLVRIDPTSGSLTASVEAAAGFPAIGAGFVWATGPRELFKIDPATNALAATIVTSGCLAVMLEDRVFCIGSEAMEIDPATDAVTPLAGAVTGWPVIGSDGLLWVVDGDALRAFEPDTGLIRADITAPEGATGWSLEAVVLDGELWATASSTGGASDRLVRINRQTMTIDCVLPTATTDFGMAVGFGSIWLPVIRQPWLLRIEPTC